MARSETTSVHSAYAMTPDYVKKHWLYDSDEGVMTWRLRTVTKMGDKIFNTQFAGKKAFTSLSTHGYPHSTKDEKRVFAHHVAWIYMNGCIPEGKEIDHLDSDKTNYKINNLQLISRSENLLKRRFHRDPLYGKVSKYVGIHYETASQRWVANLPYIDKDTGMTVRKYVGTSKTEDGVYRRMLSKAEEFGVLEEYLDRVKVVR